MLAVLVTSHNAARRGLASQVETAWEELAAFAFDASTEESAPQRAEATKFAMQLLTDASNADSKEEKQDNRLGAGRGCSGCSRESPPPSPPPPRVVCRRVL